MALAGLESPSRFGREQIAFVPSGTTGSTCTEVAVRSDPSGESPQRLEHRVSHHRQALSTDVVQLQEEVARLEEFADRLQRQLDRVIDHPTYANSGDSYRYASVGADAAVDKYLAEPERPEGSCLICGSLPGARHRARCVVEGRLLT